MLSTTCMGHMLSSVYHMYMLSTTCKIHVQVQYTYAMHIVAQAINAGTACSKQQWILGFKIPFMNT